MAISLEKALFLARNGNERGYTALFVELAAPITRFAHARDVDDPEGLTNEVFLAAFRGLDKFHGNADAFRGWIFTIARNKTIDDARSRSRRPDTVPDSPAVGPSSPDTADAVIERIEAEWVSDTLETLTDDQREVILLRVVAGLTVSEVAEVIAKPIGAVKALQRRGLRSLQKSISDEPDQLNVDGTRSE